MSLADMAIDAQMEEYLTVAKGDLNVVYDGFAATPLRPAFRIGRFQFGPRIVHPEDIKAKIRELLKESRLD